MECTDIGKNYILRNILLGNTETEMEIPKAKIEHAGEIALLNDAVKEE